MSAVESPDLSDLYNDLILQNESLDLEADNQQEPDIEIVKTCMHTGEISDLTYINHHLAL